MKIEREQQKDIAATLRDLADKLHPPQIAHFARVAAIAPMGMKMVEGDRKIVHLETWGIEKYAVVWINPEGNSFAFPITAEDKSHAIELAQDIAKAFGVPGPLTDTETLQ